MVRTHRDLGDRREHLRFDVTGRLWAALEFHKRVIVRNIALGGALIEAPWPAGFDGAARVVLRDAGPEINAIVRHVARLSERPDEQWCLIGLEFIWLTPTAREDLERFIGKWTSRLSSD